MVSIIFKLLAHYSRRGHVAPPISSAGQKLQQVRKLRYLIADIKEDARNQTEIIIWTDAFGKRKNPGPEA